MRNKLARAARASLTSVFDHPGICRSASNFKVAAQPRDVALWRGAELFFVVAAVVRDWALRKGVTPVQFSLGWLLAQKPWIVPIPGTTNPHHLNENLGAAAVKLTPDELREIRVAITNIKIQGARSRESALTDQ